MKPIYFFRFAFIVLMINSSLCLSSHISNIPLAMVCHLPSLAKKSVDVRDEEAVGRFLYDITYETESKASSLCSLYYDDKDVLVYIKLKSVSQEDKMAIFEAIILHEETQSEKTFRTLCTAHECLDNLEFLELYFCEKQKLERQYKIASKFLRAADPSLVMSISDTDSSTSNRVDVMETSFCCDSDSETRQKNEKQFILERLGSDAAKRLRIDASTKEFVKLVELMPTDMAAHDNVNFSSKENKKSLILNINLPQVNKFYESILKKTDKDFEEALKDIAIAISNLMYNNEITNKFFDEIMKQYKEAQESLIEPVVAPPSIEPKKKKNEKNTGLKLKAIGKKKKKSSLFSK